MTYTEMLARTRDMLDESSAVYWSDANLYIYLSEGQRQIVNVALKIYLAKREVIPNYPLPDILRTLIDETEDLSFGTTGTTYDSLPADFLYDLHVEYDDNGAAPIPAFRAGENAMRTFNQNNSYLGSSQSQYTYWVDGANLNFGTAISGTGSYRLTYLKKPTEIDGSTSAILPTYTHEAICKYAVSMALYKDKHPLAGEYYQLYLNELKALL